MEQVAQELECLKDYGDEWTYGSLGHVDGIDTDSRNQVPA